jgi:hypothetical protein
MSRDRGYSQAAADFVLEYMLDANDQGRRSVTVQELTEAGKPLGLDQWEIRRALQAFLMENRDVSLEQFGGKMTSNSGFLKPPRTDDRVPLKSFPTFLHPGEELTAGEAMPPFDEVHRLDSNLTIGLGQN